MSLELSKANKMTVVELGDFWKLLFWPCWWLFGGLNLDRCSLLVWVELNRYGTLGLFLMIILCVYGGSRRLRCGELGFC